MWLSIDQHAAAVSTAIPVGVTISGSAAIRSKTSRESSDRGGAAVAASRPPSSTRQRPRDQGQCRSSRSFSESRRLRIALASLQSDAVAQLEPGPFAV